MDESGELAVRGLLAWAQSHGARLHGIAPGPAAEGGRGVVATRDISPGACVLEVPRGLLMTSASAVACPVLREAAEGIKLTRSQARAKACKGIYFLFLKCL